MTWKMQSKSRCLKAGLYSFTTLFCKRATFWQINTFTLLLLCYLSTYLLERHWKSTKIEFYSPLQFIKLLLFTNINTRNTVWWCIHCLWTKKAYPGFCRTKQIRVSLPSSGLYTIDHNSLKERMQWRGLRWNPWLPT